MDPKIQRRLVEINAQFYQTFSDQFSATRQRIQPGVRRAIKAIEPGHSVLDLGCGNGNLLPALLEQGYCGQYTGIDFSPALVSLAQELIPGLLKKNPCLPKPAFASADLTQPAWEVLDGCLPADMITAFAVLHHIPGQNTRLELFKSLHRILKPEGKLLVSFWQFMNNERLRSRIVDWKEIQLSPADLDDGDFLLDWRSGGTGLRYVHLFDEPELDDLALQSGFRIAERYCSDGKEGNLGLYQTWLVQN